MRIEWKIEGQKQISRNLARIGDEITDWRAAFTVVAARLKKKFSEEAFSSQGASLGERWQPLSPEYARWKERHYPGKPILVRGGKGSEHMKDSFKTAVAADYAEIWNTASYFKYHQSNKARSKLPRRMMMNLTNDTKSEIVKIFHTYWHSKVKGNAKLTP